MLSEQTLVAFDKFRLNAKNQIYKIVYGRDGFETARRMLNWDGKNLWSDEWASQWSDVQKDRALFILFKRKIRVKYRIGIKLFVGDGDNFAGIGELHEEKRALKIWKDLLHN